MNTRLWALTIVCSVTLSSRAAEPWTFESAIAQALRQNPDVRLARQRVAAAQAGLEQANAAFMPRVQFQSGYARTDNPVSVFGYALNQRSFSSSLNFNDVPDADNLNVKGLVTVPLYAGGRNVAGRKAAQANTRAAKQDAEAVRNALAFEAARAFLSILKTRDFIRATRAGVNSFEHNLAIATKRLEGGTLLKSDVLDVEVRLAQAREDWVRARNAHELAKRVLRNLLGLEQGEIEITDSAPAATTPESGDFSQRPELAASYHRQHAAQAEVRGARGGFFPRVNAFGSADYDYGWRFDGGGKSYTGGVMLQWDWWDGNLTRARVREARANWETTQEEERKLRLALDLEVQQAKLALNEATERLAVTQKVISQAAESVEMTRARFEQGLAISTQLIDAETALVGARVRRAEAEADQRIAVAALRKALALPQVDSGSIQK